MLLLFHFIVRRNVQWNVLMFWLSVRSPARLTCNISQHAVKITFLSCPKMWAWIFKQCSTTRKICLKTLKQSGHVHISAHLGLHLTKLNLKCVNFFDIKILSPFPSLLVWLFAMLKKKKNQRNSGLSNGMSLGWDCLRGVFGKPVWQQVLFLQFHLVTLLVQKSHT